MRSKLHSNNYVSRINLDSIFIGGGTPSLLNSKQIMKIFDCINKNYYITNGSEITIECNPGAVDSEWFAEYKSIGINRISVGIQSFCNSDLQFLQRIHTKEEAIDTIKKAKSIFNNVSIDLIYGNQGQTIEMLNKNIEIAKGLDLQHISAYNLIIEEDTPLFDAMMEGIVKETSPDESADLYHHISNLLIENGFNHYEISNYAKSGFECRHNLKYWNCSNVFAVGTSAVGLVDGIRYKNIKNIDNYIKSINCNNLPNIEIEKLTKSEILEETIFLSLRSVGLDVNNLKKKFNIDLFNISKSVIFNFVNNEFAAFDNEVLKLTPKGYFVVDEITLRIMKLIEEVNNA